MMFLLYGLLAIVTLFHKGVPAIFLDKHFPIALCLLIRNEQRLNDQDISSDDGLP